MYAEQIEEVKFSFGRSPMFKGDLSRQVGMLMSTLSATGKGLALLERLTPALGQIGARHAAYGVKKRHYTAVGAALFWTLEQGLGCHFPPDVRWAWASAFELLASTLQAGAVQARQECAIESE